MVRRWGWIFESWDDHGVCWLARDPFFLLLRRCCDLWERTWERCRLGAEWVGGGRFEASMGRGGGGWWSSEWEGGATGSKQVIRVKWVEWGRGGYA